MLTVANVIDYLEQFAPKQLAASWDNVGLLLGDRAWPAERIVTCLTLTPDVAAEAVAAQAGLIVTHHPILFRAVQKLTADNAEGRMLLALAAAKTAVYSPHTAFDNTRGGINDLLAGKMGLTDVQPLRPASAAAQCKVVVFVPDSDLGKVSDALFAAGAGRIGEYAECCFRLAGTGTFFGSDAANPTVGMKGRREEVSEWRLEVICPEAQVDRVIQAMRKAHSYEEPAFDVYPLRSGPGATGDGRLGRLPQAAKLADLAAILREQLQCPAIQVVGDVMKSVAAVAIVCGAGGELLKDAIRARADVFLTGEARFHDYLAAQTAGVALLLPGHYATERCGIEELATKIQTQWPDAKVWASIAEHDPVTWLT